MRASWCPCATPMKRPEPDETDEAKLAVARMGGYPDEGETWAFSSSGPSIPTNIRSRCWPGIRRRSMRSSTTATWWRSPKRTIEQVYEQLGFPVTPEFAAALEIEQKRAKKHETTHTYSLEEFGLDDKAIRTELADQFNALRLG